MLLSLLEIIFKFVGLSCVLLTIRVVIYEIKTSVGLVFVWLIYFLLRLPLAIYAGRALFLVKTKTLFWMSLFY